MKVLQVKYLMAFWIFLFLAIGLSAKSNCTETFEELTTEGLIKDAEQGDAVAQAWLGRQYFSGKGVLPRDDKQAFYWYKKAAEQGHAEAQMMLGIMYSNGKGVPKSEKQACYWWKKAAEQGHAGAQTGLGYNYHDGEGVPQDYEQAAYWWKKAAEQGEVTAQSRLALLYYQGQGVLQDYKKAAYWYEKAAEQGAVYAQKRLGFLYDSGKGVPQNDKQACYWYKKAAEQGDATAQTRLGHLYTEGKGVSQNHKQACYWYKKAAEQGDAWAQYFLGFQYLEGHGLPQNFVHAYAWCNLAAAQGIDSATELRDIIANSLTPQQLAKAQEIAAQLQQKIDRGETSSSTTPSDNSSSQEHQIKGNGTGFIITKDGYVLTCYHVIDSAELIEVYIGDKPHSAKFVRGDKHNDLALLKISGHFSALAFSSNRSAKIGQKVFTIGYPNPVLQGVNIKLTEGTVSSLTGFQDDLRLYQISVPVQPGNSGGPLMDFNGNVVGMIVSILKAETAFKVSGSLPQNVNYALKSTYVQAMIDTIPEASENLLGPHRKQSFDDMVDRVKKSVVMVITYE